MAETTNQSTPTTVGARKYRPRFGLYKPNAKGTGCALQLELHPAHDQTDGCIMATLARQMTIGDRRGAHPTYPRFDWERAICVKLDFTDLAKMLQVFRGECESLEEGKGLYHRSPRAATRIALKHLVEPMQGYALEVRRTSTAGQEEAHAFLLLSPHEALGLAVAIEGSLSVICFGLPMVVVRDTSAYRQECKEMSDAPAA